MNKKGLTESGFLESGVEILYLLNHCNQRTDIFLKINMKVIGQICPPNCVKNVSPHSLETVSWEENCQSFFLLPSSKFNLVKWRKPSGRRKQTRSFRLRHSILHYCACASWQIFSYLLEAGRKFEKFTLFPRYYTLHLIREGQGRAEFKKQLNSSSLHVLSAYTFFSLFKVKM